MDTTTNLALTKEHIHIMIVDDTTQDLRLLSQVFEKQGYYVRTHITSTQALQSALAVPPDIILLDIKMPVMDGYTFCKKLKANSQNSQARNIPVIFISALDDIPNKIQGFQHGGIDYVTKPFHTAELIARVETHLTNRHLMRYLETYTHYLQEEIAQRQKAEEDLLHTLNDLDNQVQQQTGEITDTNQLLRKEISQSERLLQEKDQLLAVMNQQSQQVLMLSNVLLNMQQQFHETHISSLQRSLQQKIHLIESHLSFIGSAKYHQDDVSTMNTMITQHNTFAQEILRQMQTDLLIDEENSGCPAIDIHDLVRQLSYGERKTFLLLGEGKTTREIAIELSVSSSTVYTYRKRILEKFCINNMSVLTKVAVEYHREHGNTHMQEQEQKQEIAQVISP